MNGWSRIHIGSNPGTRIITCDRCNGGLEDEYVAIEVTGHAHLRLCEPCTKRIFAEDLRRLREGLPV